MSANWNKPRPTQVTRPCLRVAIARDSRRRTKRLWRHWASWLLLLLWAGCASTTRQRPPAPVSADGVDELHLLAMPLAIDLDQVPGPDGFAIRVYAGNFRNPKSLRIESGRLEILMYDGVLAASVMLTNTPLRTWSYTAEQLPAYLMQTAIGSVYSLALPWGEAKPRKDKITVAARFVASKGSSVYSAPSTIAVASK